MLLVGAFIESKYGSGKRLGIGRSASQTQTSLSDRGSSLDPKKKCIYSDAQPHRPLFIYSAPVGCIYLLCAIAHA